MAADCGGGLGHGFLDLRGLQLRDGAQSQVFERDGPGLDPDCLVDGFVIGQFNVDHVVASWHQDGLGQG